MSTMPPTSADEAELRLLLRLDDDALDSVLSKLDAPHEDALFIALACKRLRAAVLRRLAPLEEAHRNTYHLLAAPVRLRTNITGGFASVARVAFVHDCDCTDQTLTAQRVPISVLFRMVQHLPWPFLRCLYFERRACRKWDLVAHPEHRALLAFAALHGRCDILDALFEKIAGNPHSNLLHVRLIRDLCAGGDWPDYGPTSEGVDDWQLLMRVLVRPAIIGGHRRTMEWLVGAIEKLSRKQNVGMLDDQFCWFGPLRLQRSTHTQSVCSYRGAWQTWFKLIRDAARHGHVWLFEDALPRMVQVWMPGRVWAVSLCYTLLVRAFASGHCLGSMAEALTAFCRKWTYQLRNMFLLPHRLHRFDLKDLVDAYPFTEHANPYVLAQHPFRVDGHTRALVQSLTRAVFTPGDEAYCRWVLREAGMDADAKGSDPCDEGFLERSLVALDAEWGFYNKARDRNAVSSLCRIMIRLQLQPSSTRRSTPLHYERQAPAFGTPNSDARSVGILQGFTEEQKLAHDVERHLFSRSPLATEERPGAPNRLQKGVAFVTQRWLENELDARADPMVDREWGNSLHCFTHVPMAMLPVVATLSERYTRNGRRAHLEALGNIVLDMFRVLFGTGTYADHDQDTLLAHARLGYRRQLFSRFAFDAAAEALGLRDYAKRTRAYKVRAELLAAFQQCFDDADAERHTP